ILAHTNDLQHSLVTIPVTLTTICSDSDADGVTDCAGDCDDHNPSAHPGAHETCDGIDNDCNGVADDGPRSTTRGIRASARTVPNCSQGVPVACVPGTPTSEVCNGIDDDCDGLTDEGQGTAPISGPCYTGPAGTEGVGVCHGGTVTCVNGQTSGCVGEITPS